MSLSLPKCVDLGKKLPIIHFCLAPQECDRNKKYIDNNKCEIVMRYLERITATVSTSKEKKRYPPGTMDADLAGTLAFIPSSNGWH
jgi:hypothetical protein